MTRPVSPRLPLVALAAFGAVALSAAAADAQVPNQPKAIGVQLGAYFEDGEVDDTYMVSVNDQSDSFDYEADGTFNVAVNYMDHWTESVRLGATLRYYGAYGATPITDDEDEDDLPPTFVMGPLLETLGEIEWLVPVIGAEWELALGGQLGLATLFPDRDLEAQINDLNDQGIGVWTTPRLGYTFGARVGARYRLTERFGLNASYGVQVSEIFIYATEEEVDTIPVKRDTSLGIIRQNIVVGTEVFF